MTTYHINPFSGSDAANGTSWGTALKTFFPFESGALSLLAGDLVKIAKTDDAEAVTQTYAGLTLTSYSTTYGTADWTPLYGYGLVAGFNTRVKVIAAFQNTTGITNGLCSIYTESNSWSNLDGQSWLQMGYVDTGWVNNGKLFHYAPGTTLNLSGFGRLEWRIFGYGQSDTIQTEQQLKLCLCSDTAGDVPITTILFYPSSANSTIYAYEGALPDGVNSISIRLGAVQGGGGHYGFSSMIATQAYSSANYFGFFTQVRFGAHEGAFYHPLWAFYESGGMTYFQVIYGNCGPASVNNTTMNAYFRKSISWSYAGYQPFNTMYYGNNRNPYDDNHRLILDQTRGKMRTLFNLLDKNGSAGNPIVIEGGYDTNTNTVTGKTALLSRSPNYTNFNMVSPIAVGTTSYITFKNIDIFTPFMGTIMAAGGEDAHHLRFENCELVAMTVYGPAYYYASSLAAYALETRPTLHDLYYKNCTGNFLPTYFAQSDNCSNQSEIYNITLESCVLTPYSGPWHHYGNGNENIPGYSPITLVGDLKIYCMGGNTFLPYSLNPNLIDGNRIILPPFVTGAAGTVYVYGGGMVQLHPGAPLSQTSGTYTYPRFEFENTTPVFTDSNVRFGDAYFGSVDNAVVPYIKSTFTAAGWCGRALNASYYSDYKVSWIITVEASSPPLDVQQLIIDGSPYAASLSSVHSILGAQATETRIGNITAPTAGATWNFALLAQMVYLSSGAGSYRNLQPSPRGPSLHIFDGITMSRATTSLTEACAQYNSGANEVVAHVEMRNITWANTSATYRMYWSPNSQGSLALLRFIDCNITQPNLFYNPIYNYPYMRNAVDITRENGNYGESGYFIKNCNDSILNPALPGYGYGAGNNEWTTSDRLIWSRGITWSKDQSNVHETYFYCTTLSRDYTNYHSSAFSWKSEMKMQATVPWTAAYPLGSFPAKIGKTMTITLWVRRSSNTDCFGGLILLHHGAAANATASDYQELTAFASGSANVWEQVQIQFVVQQSCIVELFVSHYGAFGTFFWFDDVRVMEA